MAIDHLLYVSQARSGLPDSEIEAILAQSRSNNPALSVTGILLFVRRDEGRAGSFMQLLEGEAADLERLRRRIFDDPRHHTKIVIEQGSKPQRDFADWSMAYRNATPASLAAYPEFSELGEEHFMRKCREGRISGAGRFLHDFWNEAG